MSAHRTMCQVRPRLAPVAFLLTGLSLLTACCGKPPTYDPLRSSRGTSTDVAPETLTAPADPASRPGSPPPDAWETFDVVWETVDQRHFDPEHHGVDWDAVRERYRPRIEEIRSRAELRRLLAEMLAELGQTHFVIIPQEASDAAQAVADEDGVEPTDATDGDPGDTEEPTDATDEGDGHSGMFLDWSGEEAVVVRLDDDAPAARAGVKPGWRLVSVGDFEPTTALAGIREVATASTAPFATTQAAMVLNARAARGPAGASRTFTFEDSDGRRHDLDLVFEREPGLRAGFGLLPPSPVRTSVRLLEDDELAAWNIPPMADGSSPRIALLAFNIWMFPILQPVAQAVDAHRDVDGFILDLRGNPGGVGGLAMGVAGHFLGERESLGDLVSREATMHFSVNPQRATPDGRLVEPFAGPVALVVDSGSASTSEVFAAGMQQIGRARVVGRPSAGAALPAHLKTLPNGDTFLFAIADFIGPAGHSIEGTGVLPDIVVPIDRLRLEAETDPDLKAAASWIRGELPAE